MPRPSDVVVVLNPKSGRGKGSRLLDDLTALLDKYCGDKTWRIAETRGSRDGQRLAREAANSGAGIVVSGGGDGTLNEVLNGVFGTESILAVLPLGTGNDVARTIGIGTDLELAVRTVFEGTPTPTDVGLARGNYFINVAGCGFDAVVAERVNAGYKNLSGTAAYIVGVMDTLRSFEPADMTITVDGETTRVKAMMCSVANCKTYGGGMKIAPNADITDGYFDICILKDASKLEFVMAFPKVFSGRHINHPKVMMLKGKEVTVESSRPMPVLMDGDIFGTTPIKFEMRAQAIKLMMPV